MQILTLMASSSPKPERRSWECLQQYREDIEGFLLQETFVKKRVSYFSYQFCTLTCGFNKRIIEEVLPVDVG